MFLGPARLDIFLAPLGWRPVGRHGAVVDEDLLLLVQRLLRLGRQQPFSHTLQIAGECLERLNRLVA